MAEPAIDLFKFVTLRSPDEPDPTQTSLRYIRDPRVKNVRRYPRPDADKDAADFAGSPAAAEIHRAVRGALADLADGSQIPAKNRSIAAYYARLPLEPHGDSRGRIRTLVAQVTKKPLKTMAEVDTAIQEGITRIDAGWTLADYAGGGPSPLEIDLGEAFDALYRAYVAKQVRPLNLEEWFTAIRVLHAVRGVFLGRPVQGALPPLPRGGVRVRTIGQFQAVMTASPMIHPLFALLLGYYRPFNTIEPVGIGDLLVVKQFLKGYEPGEIAHVENVLPGERKTRTHRVLDRTEDTLLIESETVEETLRELQTTDRFELKAETEATIDNDLNTEMSGQVSGRYGVVEVSASAGVSYSMSTSDSRRSSNNFAKDVIDRSLSRIQRRVREERTTRRTHEVEETNQHVLDNTGKEKRVTGVYRWLDKRYTAQVFNYGKRLMFEFVLPEPAAFVIRAFEHNRAPEAPPRLPQPPARPNLVISQITQATVDAYAAIFPLGDVRPEPLATMSVSKVITGSDLGGQVATAHEKQFDIPEDYAVTRATISGAYEGVNRPAQGNDWGVFVSIGGQTRVASHPKDGGGDYHQVFPPTTITFDPPLTGPQGISVLAYRVDAFEVSAALDLTLTAKARRAWQIDVYNAIMDAYGRAEAAYRAELEEYRDRMAGYTISQGVVIRGRNPRVNQEIIRTELKKGCLAMIALQFDANRSDDVVFDAMKSRPESIERPAVTRTEVETVTTTRPDPATTVTVTTTTIEEQVVTAETPIDIPAVDVPDAVAEGQIIQFLEQAFEWQQISYVLYPYFWGRLPEKWFDAQRYLDEEDPLFARFLQAGAVRVLVAARPGFEMAVMHYLRTRQPWNGGPAPSLDDPLYVAVHEELRDQQDDLNGAEPYGDPWDVVVPTSLVYLQSDDRLPTFGEPKRS